MGLGLPDHLIVFCRVLWWPKGRAWIEKRPDRIVIVKVQIPLAITDDPDPKALVYDENRDVYGVAPIEGALRKAMGDREKGYFFAQSKGKALRLYGRAANQDW